MAALCILCILMVATGCVYLRLYRFRGQLASFDQYCEFRHDPGPVLSFKEPVLRPEDIEWLLDLPVSEVQDAVDGDVLHVFRFRKCEGDDARDWSRDSLQVGMLERNGRVAEVRLPPRLNPLLDRERLMRAFQGAAGAPIDRDRGETGWVLDDRLAFPVLPELIQGFGEPCERVPQGWSESLVYRYWLVRQDAGNPAPSDSDVEAVFLYDTVRERISASWVRVGCLRVDIVGVPGQSYRVVLRRSPK